MKIREFIEMLEDVYDEEGNLEVVATNEETEETYTPAIRWGPDKDGTRRLFLTS